MTRLRVAVVPLLEGKERELFCPLSVEVSATLSSPAAGMSGTFAVEYPPGDIGAVRVWRDGGETLFEGMVDSQRLVLSEGGLLLELEARSRGALLLDNEAQPCALANCQMSALFGKVAAPYGFVLYNPNPSYTMALYTVRGGMSCWEALAGFSRRAWGITPYVEEGQVVVGRPRSAAVLTLSNTGEGVPFTRLEDSYIPYKMVSRVVLRDEWGNYDSYVDNSSAAYHQVERRRYVIPANEFVDAPAMDANQRIRKSMLESRDTVAVLPGLVLCRKGQEVQVVDRAVELYNRMAGEVRYRQDAGGMVTRLRLVSSLYWG